MSFSNIQATFELKGGGTFRTNADGSVVSGRLNIPGTLWDAIVTGFRYSASLDTVTDNVGYAGLAWADERIVTAAGTDHLDLAGTLSFMGETTVFTKIKFILVQIEAPDGTKVLRIGPQAVANAFQGPFSGGAGATVYKEVVDWDIIVNDKWDGYAVGAGATDVLGISNPGAGDVTYRIVIFGR